MLGYREFVCGCDEGAAALAVSYMAVRAPWSFVLAVAGQVCRFSGAGVETGAGFPVALS